MKTSLLLLVVALPLFFDTAADNKTEQYAKAQSRTYVLSQRGKKAKPQRHSVAHTLHSVIVRTVFLLFRASGKKHSQQQSHHDPWQCRLKKIRNIFHHQRFPFLEISFLLSAYR